MATWKEILSLTKGNKVTNKFHAATPNGVTYSTGKHEGVDMVLKNDKIPSFTSGTVYKTGYDPKGFGNYAVVKNNDGFYTIYAHMNKTAVKTGDRVNEGSLIGIQGQTGQAKGKHLHLEVRSDYANSKSTLNPNFYFSENPRLNYTAKNDAAARVTNEEIKEAVVEKGLWNWICEKLGDFSYGFMLRSGFILVGSFMIYIAVTKGLFGGSGE